MFPFIFSEINVVFKKWSCRDSTINEEFSGIAQMLLPSTTTDLNSLKVNVFSKGSDNKYYLASKTD